MFGGGGGGGGGGGRDSVFVCVHGGGTDRSHRSHKFKQEKCCRMGEVSVGGR